MRAPSVLWEGGMFPVPNGEPGAEEQSSVEYAVGKLFP